MPATRTISAATPPVRPVPTWSRIRAGLPEEADAIFAAGAGLAALDGFVRSEPDFAGVWRQRLALAAAASSTRLLGRREDEAQLRDAWCLRKAGDAPGPGGAILGLWHRFARSRTGRIEADFEAMAMVLGLDLKSRAGEIARLLDGTMREEVLPLRAAIELTQALAAVLPHDAEVLVLLLADFTLATRMGWPIPVPLLTTQIHHPILRQGEPRRRPRVGEGTWPATMATAYALAAAGALDLAADLARRATALQAAVPKLRAKGAQAVVAAVLEEDALAPASASAAMSDRALRRLFDRLVTLGGVRELSGRPSFRLYGL